MLCYILEDRKAKELYQGMRAVYPDWEFPLRDNVLSPLEYIDEIFQADPDYILLDNYFPDRNGPGGVPLGAEFLERFIGHYRADGKDCTAKVVSISNNGTKLLQKFTVWQQAYESGLVVGFAPGKSVQEVQEIIA